MAKCVFAGRRINPRLLESLSGQISFEKKKSRDVTFFLSSPACGGGCGRSHIASAVLTLSDAAGCSLCGSFLSHETDSCRWKNHPVPLSIMVIPPWIIRLLSSTTEEMEEKGRAGETGIEVLLPCQLVQKEAPRAGGRKRGVPLPRKGWRCGSHGRADTGKRSDCFVLIFLYLFCFVADHGVLWEEACVSVMSIYIFVDDWVGLRPCG